MRARLLSDVKDLLPGASLVPLAEHAVADGSRQLASLPVVLVPAPLVPDGQGVSSALRSVLLVAWAGVLLAALAVGLLLRGTVALSERRAELVSAVTHELRTPLTTFRMYTEMLADGMVEAAKRQDYLETLKREAVRLSHLVENVLAYSRIERGGRRAPFQMEQLDARDVLDRCLPRLQERARQAGMTIVVSGPAGPLPVRGDASALEQVLFNLVDNAGKYAAGATEKSIEASLGKEGPAVTFRLRDHGPGGARDARRRLFEPFSKSAERAAETAQGSGVGPGAQPPPRARDGRRPAARRGGWGRLLRVELAAGGWRPGSYGVRDSRGGTGPAERRVLDAAGSLGEVGGRIPCQRQLPGAARRRRPQRMVRPRSAPPRAARPEPASNPGGRYRSTMGPELTSGTTMAS